MPTSDHQATHYLNGWSRWRDADAMITVSFSKSRWRRGEFVIVSTYRLPDGAVEVGDNRRVYLDHAVGPTVRELWAVLFEEAAGARQHNPRTLAIKLEFEGLPALWKARLRAVAEVAASEVHAVVRGTAPMVEREV
jgi:hypothetical protein